MYKVIKKAISRELAEFCYDYFCNKRKVARLFFDARYISQFNTDWGVWNDEQVPETYSQYAIWLWKLYWKKYSQSWK